MVTRQSHNLKLVGSIPAPGIVKMSRLFLKKNKKTLYNLNAIFKYKICFLHFKTMFLGT
jgi:hypothetical protein